MNRTSLSSLKSRLYRKPKAELQKLKRWGVGAYFRCDQWAAEMEASVASLPAPDFDATLPPIETFFLTGERFWYQTAYCAWTLSQQSGREVILNLVDDGTLTTPYLEPLRALFPKGNLLESRSLEERLDSLLPRNRFPVLRQRCDDYINIRKLVDVHLGTAGWKLVLDSDMLFFASPTEITDWSEAARSESEDCPLLLMRDCEESYGYSRNLMESLTGTPIPELLNVGVCGIRSETINWEEMEEWCFRLAAAEGTSYFLEQALVAMMASRLPYRVLPRDRYITFPSGPAILGSHGVLQHYVSDSKPGYFGRAWKNARASAPPTAAIELPA